MDLRELLFAAALAACFGCITYGVFLFSEPGGFITGGGLFGVWSFLVLSR